MSDFLATNEFPGTGAAMQVDINFAGVRLDDPMHPPPYLEADDVKAIIITPATPTTVEVQTPVALVKINDLTFTTAPTVVPLGNILRVFRDTDIEFPIVDFVSLQVVTESDLDNQAKQTLYAVMEARDQAAIAVDRAEAAGAVAVEANLTSQEALAKAEQAIVTADNADSKADNAVIVAGQADDKSDAALLAAQNAEDHATNVEVLAAQAADDAAEAATLAGTANTNASTALSTANAIDGKAQSALDASSAAVTTANAAADTANSIDGKAQTALEDSAFALTAANAAVVTANGVDAKAQSALDASAAAQPGDATLSALAALVTAANQLIYSTGVDAFAQTALTAFARTILDDADAAAARTTLELKTGAIADVVGAVASGAVIEYTPAGTVGGTVGDCTRYQDGTQICTVRLTGAVAVSSGIGSMFNSTAVVGTGGLWARPFLAGTFPIVPAPMVNLSGAVCCGVPMNATPTPTALPTFFILCPVSNVGVNYTIHLVAIGRWK